MNNADRRNYLRKAGVYVLVGTRWALVKLAHGSLWLAAKASRGIAKLKGA